MKPDQKLLVRKKYPCFWKLTPHFSNVNLQIPTPFYEAESEANIEYK